MLFTDTKRMQRLTEITIMVSISLPFTVTIDIIITLKVDKNVYEDWQY